MEEKVLVIGFKGVDFTNGDGEKIKSCKVTYVPNFAINDGLSLGYLPIQIKLSDEVKNSLKEVPGVYKPIYSMVPGPGNLPRPQLTGLQFIKTVDFKEIFK